MTVPDAPTAAELAQAIAEEAERRRLREQAARTPNRTAPEDPDGINQPWPMGFGRL